MFAADLTAAEIISMLDLVPHPEGGHYCETFRDRETDAAGRARSTAIYYLLEAGELSAWHRVDAVEIWHWHAGGPLALTISENGHDARTLHLGHDLAAGQRPQGIVPAGAWQTAATGLSARTKASIRLMEWPSSARSHSGPCPPG